MAALLLVAVVVLVVCGCNIALGHHFVDGLVERPSPQFSLRACEFRLFIDQRTYLFNFGLSGELDDGFLEEIGQRFDDLVFFIELLVANLVDVVLEEKHLDVVGLRGVPLVRLENLLKLLK